MLAIGPRATNTVLMQHPAVQAPYFCRPVGGAPKNKYWDTSSGCWIQECDVNAESPEAYVKRPRGPTPKGKRWEGTTGEWVDDPCCDVVETA